MTVSRVPQPAASFPGAHTKEPTVIKKLALLGLLGVAISARAQVAVPPAEVPAVEGLINSRINSGSLNCRVGSWSPFLDLDFRYETGFVVSLLASQIARETTFNMYLRVTPRGGAPTYLRAVLDPAREPWFPSASADEKVLQKTELTTSGAFDVGEGSYTVEILLTSGPRSRYKRWRVEASKYTKQVAPLALKPGTVAPLAPESWDGKLDTRGLKLAVLLDAAPMDPSSLHLQVWDRTFLLQAVGTLLKQVPCREVELIAFSLEQQREVFRKKGFDAEGFSELEDTLKNLEFSTISYQALRRDAWRDFLQQLTVEQLSRADPPDALVFIGPVVEYTERASVPAEPARSRVFYFEFHRWPTFFPDAIDHLTKALHGTVFPIHSANDLAIAIQKMLQKTSESGPGYLR